MKPTRITRIRLAVIVSAVALSAAALAAGKWQYRPSGAEGQALAAISPASLQAHLSFLSADALEGRASGSTGLEVAAEYVAAEFRRAGLKPAGDDGYFQTTPRVRLAPTTEGYECRLAVNGGAVDVEPGHFALVTGPGSNSPAMREIHIEDASLVKVPFGGPYPEKLEDAAHTVIITELPAAPADATERTAFTTRRNEFLTRLMTLRPALVAEIRRDASTRIDYFASRQLFDPQLKGKAMPGLPTVCLSDGASAALYDSLKAGATGARFTVRLGTPVETDAPQHNVIALLRGSDPKLAGTYVLVTAHYDGQGTRPGPDRIWNSANDNGTGTVAVIELASALAALKKPPRRSIVFIAFHGEEGGLIGSRFYAQHPIFPLESTVADLNIEMIGRTDDVDGNQRRRASLTGFDYSDLGEIYRHAGLQTGVTVFKHEKNSDRYFTASDNQPLAAQGVPAHTICVAFQPPDYHGPADTWQKVDYENMAVTVRMIGTALLTVAQSDAEPRWNPAVPQASRYLEAWKKRHPGDGGSAGRSTGQQSR
jgi:hypothetical protein